MLSSVHLGAIAAALGCDYAGPALAVRRLAIDSRAVAAGDLFVALRGARVDGHDFVAAAAAAGAVAALVEAPVDTAIPTLMVADSQQAMSRIAAENRAAYRGGLAAVTGSCGKTTVKNLCHSILKRAAPSVATAGNFNNEIGVPLTLSRLDDDTRYAIVEMGAAGRGHIAHLCDLARPQVSVVLNALEAHLEGFGSLHGVAAMKAEIYDSLAAGNIALLDLDQPWAPLWRERIAATGAQLLTYSASADADVRIVDTQLLDGPGRRLTVDLAGTQRSFELALPGQHNVSNALAAAAIAVALGIPADTIASGIAAARGEPGRLQREVLADGTVLIDDSYNANPGSVRAAIDVLAEAGGSSALLLGEMLELGTESEVQHAAMGRYARERGLARFVGVGAALAPAVQAFGSGAALFADREALGEALPELLESCDCVLVKGSRGAAMESVVEVLRNVSREMQPC